MSLPRSLALVPARAPLASAAEAAARLDALWKTAALAATSTAERALVGGACTDRVAYATMAGYAMALTRLVAPRDFPRAAFCMSERGGNHPRAIETALFEEGGTLRVRGEKSFVTLAELATHYVVIAKRGVWPDGRSDLVAVVVAAGAPGTRLVPRSPLPFVPELPHAALELDGAAVTDVLPGDGFEAWGRPFRAVEDLHVTLAVLGYALGEARAHGMVAGDDDGALARAAALLLPLADADLTGKTALVTLDEALAAARAALDATPWADAGGEVAARWQRDRPLLEVAARARDARAAKVRGTAPA